MILNYHNRIILSNVLIVQIWVVVNDFNLMTWDLNFFEIEVRIQFRDKRKFGWLTILRIQFRIENLGRFFLIHSI